MDKIINIQHVDPTTLQLQTYNTTDEALIVNVEVPVIFDSSQDYLEYFILDLNNNILKGNTSGYPGYKIQNGNIVIDPQNDLELAGYTEGQYYTIYNFLKRKLSSSPNSVLYIQDISADRTELRLNTNQISNIDIVDLTTQFANDIFNAKGSYKDFYLNFGDNKLIIAVNIALDNSNSNDPTVLVKLYEALPVDFNINSKCWVVESVADSQAYKINISTIFTVNEKLNYLNGPNYNLDIKDQINNTTTYQNYNSLSQNSSILGSGSLLYQINNLLSEKGININIDYSDYSNFIHFSTAQTRLENFYYKLSLIEQYTSNANMFNNSNIYTSASKTIWDSKINDIVTNFDGYEYFLFYSSESHAWPKLNSTPPFTNYNTTSPISVNWFNEQSISASIFDENNSNNLINTIPLYLREDPDNNNYFLFTQMIGQNFDNIWVYLKDITNKFDADNRINFGISKDIVAQAIRDLGVNIYQNNFSEADIYSVLIGLTPSGSTLLLPFITGSLPTPSGYEYINNIILASDPNSQEPLDDVNKEIYKRIYHNLPLLLKKKGTPEGLRLLINIYGIPDTILRINEFGGKSREINNNWDNFQDVFNYSLEFGTNGYLYVPYTSQNSVIPTGSYQFRFKTNGIPSSSNNQVLFHSYATNNQSQFAVVLEYSSSISSSYSGSSQNLYKEYGTLKLTNAFGSSASIYLPFFDGGWWSVMVNNIYTSSSIFVGNNIYDGYDGNKIGFKSSGSVNIINQIWASSSLYLSFPTNIIIPTVIGKTYHPFTGSFQELRYYNVPLSESIFDNFIMNPYSIEGNQISDSQTSLNNLRFRAPLGTMLDSSSDSTRTSIHPSISTNPSTSSFSVGSTYYIHDNFFFNHNYETIYQNQFAAGVKNQITEKIKIVNNTYPSGNTLSPYISIQQTSYTEENFSKNINYVEVAFSPQDEINDDIISQLGNFNIGEYIGDPRQVSSSATSYPDFNKLRNIYFSKYTSNYNLWDYIRLIKYYDNSLFKMIKDFTPARTNLATGIVIKQTLLERNKYPLPQVNTDSTIAWLGSPTSRTLNIPD